MSRDVSRSIQPAAWSPVRLAVAFAAGFIAVVIFHQGMLAALYAFGLTSHAPFSMQPTAPLGVPVLWSLAFWGGVWGLVFAWIERRFPRGAGYWWAALVFGALGPTLVALLVVLPLKGMPMGGGWRPAGIVIGLLVNGAWGIGTALLFRIVYRPHAT